MCGPANAAAPRRPIAIHRLRFLRRHGSSRNSRGQCDGMRAAVLGCNPRVCTTSGTARDNHSFGTAGHICRRDKGHGHRAAAFRSGPRPAAMGRTLCRQHHFAARLRRQLVLCCDCHPCTRWPEGVSRQHRVAAGAPYQLDSSTGVPAGCALSPSTHWVERSWMRSARDERCGAFLAWISITT